jgi:hypothetical protein
MKLLFPMIVLSSLSSLCFAREIRLNWGHLPPVQRAYATYGFAHFHPEMSSVFSLGSSQLTINVDLLGESEKKFFEDFERLGSTYDHGEFVNRWTRISNTLRHNVQNAELITDNLNEFKRSTGFESWPKQVLEVSSIKKTKRIIYRSPEDFDRAVSVAVTVQKINGVEHEREHEVAVTRLDGSDNYDFYAYDSSGALVQYSEFPAGRLPAPKSCAGCHMNAATGKVNRLMPNH